MDRLRIAKSRVGEWVAKLRAGAAVYAPVEQAGTVCFARLPQGAAPNLDYGNTDVPMKEVLFPQTECLLTWQRLPEGLKVAEVDASEPTVIFGARACDVTGLSFLDRAFTLGGIEDPYYVRRREKTTIVAAVCPHPVGACFGPSAGVDELSPVGADVVLTDLGDAYAVEVKSERGRAAVGAAEDCFTPATEGEIGRASCRERV